MSASVYRPETNTTLISRTDLSPRIQGIQGRRIRLVLGTPLACLVTPNTAVCIAKFTKRCFAAFHYNTPLYYNFWRCHRQGLLSLSQMYLVSCQTGLWTHRTQDSSDPRHFGTSAEVVPRCLYTSAPRHVDTKTVRSLWRDSLERGARQFGT